jgi:hypothetical protein
LAFQNQCRQFPFALFAWAGEPEHATPPSCAALRARIAPAPDSEPAEVDCLDEGAVALRSPATAAFFQQRSGVSFEDGLLFSIAADPASTPQNWSTLRESVIAASGSKWLDRAQPAAVITAHGVPCGVPVGRCDVPFWIRPGTTDSAVLGQVVARMEYHFLLDLQLPPPETVLDAGGALWCGPHGRRTLALLMHACRAANCGIASVLFAAFFPQAQIVSIEPASDNFAALQKNVARCGLPWRNACLWRPRPAAVRSKCTDLLPRRSANIHPVKAALWGEHAELSVVKGVRWALERAAFVHR